MNNEFRALINKNNSVTGDIIDYEDLKVEEINIRL